MTWVEMDTLHLLLELLGLARESKYHNRVSKRKSKVHQSLLQLGNNKVSSKLTGKRQ